MKSSGFLILILSLLVLGSCDGPIGYEPGGEDIFLEARMISGKAAPSDTVGVDGDLYLDTDAAVLYVKTNGAWLSVADLKGPPGENGNTWLTGSGIPAEAIGADGDLYLDTAASVIYKKNAVQWTLISSLGGETSNQSWTYGDGVPEEGSGEAGDFYLDTASSFVYVKNETEWKLLMSLSGPPGEPGSPGLPGASGTLWHVTTEKPDDTVGANGDFCLDSETTKVYQKSDGQWAELLTLAGPSGMDGAAGSLWYSGNGIPDNAIGVDGDFYLDAQNKLIYEKATGAWVSLVSLQGEQGEAGDPGVAGADGSVWYYGNGDPDSEPAFESGKDGDLYLDTATADVYSKTTGSWVFIVNIKGNAGQDGEDGEDGQDGAAGAAGVNGADGATWLTGSGTPNNESGKEGDLYLNTATADVYSKTTGSWVFIVNIKGNAGQDGEDGEDGQDGAAGAAGVNGADGATWLTGSGTPNNESGKDGDLYLDTATADVYSKTTGSWVFIVNIKGNAGQDGEDGEDGQDGAAGAAGVNGADGATWLTGSGTPNNESGKDGDLYLDTSSAAVYVKSTGTWVYQMNIKGDQGEAGQNGQAGATWFVDSYDPSNPAFTGGVEGDFFLNATNSAVYKKISGVWTLQAYLTPASTGAEAALSLINPGAFGQVDVGLAITGTLDATETGYVSALPLTVAADPAFGGDSFRWYLNGVKLPLTTNSIELSELSLGTNSISVLVVKNGETYSSQTCVFHVLYEGGL